MENIVEMHNVYIDYPLKKYTLHAVSDVSMVIKRGKITALVGESGSGKSTITKLIMRLYEVEDGEILMHGYNIKKYSLHDLRRSIGIVPQEPFIFQMSIIDNITHIFNNRKCRSLH